MSDRLVPKLLAEFIGTFSFVFIGAGTAAVVGDGVGLPGIVAIALAHGLAITTFAAAIFYVISQLLGGMAGALLLRTVLGGTATGLSTPALAHDLALGGISLTIKSAAGFMIETVLAFFLVTVVLSTAVAGRARNVAPLVIGMTLTFNILMGGALTGAAFNPARALGPMVATGKFDDAWLYLVAPIVGAIIAAIVHRTLGQLTSDGSVAGKVAPEPTQ
jgi:glycerol uptake facilitator-like aquaporin